MIGGWTNLHVEMAATEIDIKLDKPIQADNRIGGGAFGAVYKVYVNGTECIAKRLHDILTGSR